MRGPGWRYKAIGNRWLRWGRIRNEQGEPYLNRLPLIVWKSGWSLYLHHFIGDDVSLPHDHPKWFISIGLWGSYKEEIFKKGVLHAVRTYTAPWIRFFPAEHQHRLFLESLPELKRGKLKYPSRSCWTLVISGRPFRKWGFWHSNGTFKEAELD